MYHRGPVDRTGLQVQVQVQVFPFFLRNPGYRRFKKSVCTARNLFLKKMRISNSTRQRRYPVPKLDRPEESKNPDTLVNFKILNFSDLIFKITNKLIHNIAE